MLFHFRLGPLDDHHEGLVGGNVRRRWYEMTWGEYWIDTGAGELFRHSEAYIGHAATAWIKLPAHDETYILWFCRDAAEMLPHVLQPVPAEVVRALPPGREALEWSLALAGEEDEYAPACHRPLSGLVGTAAQWMYHRRLDTSKFRAGPRIWLWSDGADVHIRWDNRGQTFKGDPIWALETGSVALPVGSFIAEVRSAHERLIGEMAERIEAVSRHWPHREIRMYPRLLRAEQKLQAAALDQALARRVPPVDWNAVLAAIAELKRAHPFPGG